jgi:hypothetical protein
MRLRNDAFVELKTRAVLGEFDDGTNKVLRLISFRIRIRIRIDSFDVPVQKSITFLLLHSTEYTRVRTLY